MRLLIVTLLLPLVLFPGYSHAQTSLPIIDGNISPGEWNGAYNLKLEMSDGEMMSLAFILSPYQIFILASLEHNGPGDVITLHPENYETDRHDYFGIEFDNNDDGVPMGTNENPDDLIMVDYLVEGARDMFSHSFTVFDDVESGGSNNVEGHSSQMNGIIFWEVSKKLNSEDDAGHDLKISRNNTFHIMVAFWNDQKVHSSAAEINKSPSPDIFIPIRIDDIKYDLISEIITISVFVLSFPIAYFVYLRSRKSRNRAWIQIS